MKNQLVCRRNFLSGAVAGLTGLAGTTATHAQEAVESQRRHNQPNSYTPSGLGSAVHNNPDWIRLPVSDLRMSIPCGADSRPLDLYLGRSFRDREREEEATVVLYHQLPLDLVLPPHPLPEMPECVHRVEAIGPDTYVELRFRRSSNLLRDAWKSLWATMRPAWLENKMKELGVKDCTIEVVPEPVYDLFMAITDDVTGLLLSYSKENVRNAGETVSLWFRFRPDELRRFIELWETDLIEFRPIPHCKFKSMAHGWRRSQVDYQLGVRAKANLRVEQTTKSGIKTRVISEPTVLPILYKDVQDVARAVAAEVKESFVAENPAVLDLMQASTVTPDLLANVFQRTSISFRTFPEAFPGFTAQMLAQYLKPQVKTEITTNTDIGIKGQRSVQQSSSQAGGGGGIRFGPVSLQFTATGSRGKLRQIYEEKGIRFEKQDEHSSIIFPKSVDVFLLRAGSDQVKLSHTAHYSVGTEDIDAYFKETPFKKDWTTTAVDESLAAVFDKSQQRNRLRKQLAELQVARQQRQQELTAALNQLEKLRVSIADLPEVVKERHDTAIKNMALASSEHGKKAWLFHSHDVWGHHSDPEALWRDHMAVRDDDQTMTRQQLFDLAEKELAQANSEFVATVKRLEEDQKTFSQELSTLGTVLEQLAVLEGEIEAVNRELIAL